MSCLDQLFSGSIALIIMSAFNEYSKYSWRHHTELGKTDFGGERFKLKEIFAFPFCVFAGSSVPA